jgi:nicotinamide-nucleotide amidase
LLQVKVGDNHQRIVDVVRSALREADAVIMCGGLGPTHDDLTREAIAEVMGVDLVMHDDIAQVIRNIFESRGRRMADNNLQQAMVPVGATVIHQTRGTAPGLMCPVGDKVIYAVPGVPHEMQDMMERAILPDLRARSGDTSVIASRVIRTWGESESGLNERLNPIIAELEVIGNPTLAFLASGWEGIKVRLTAKGADSQQAHAVLDDWQAKVLEIVGDVVFGFDANNMESVVLNLLREQGLTLGLAESVTGGLVSGRLTSIPGASDVLRGSVVSYASEVKFDLLDVPRGPVVSEAAAIAMAEGARRVLGADVARNQVWLQRSGEDLLVSIMGTTDSSRVLGWYSANTTSRLDSFVAGDGRVMTEARVEALVQAMATMAPPPVGQTSLTTEQQTALNTTIAAAWQ